VGAIFVAPFVALLVAVGSHAPPHAALGWCAFALQIYLLVRLIFWREVIVVEAAGLARASRRSWNLVRGNWWRLAFLAAVTWWGAGMRLDRPLPGGGAHLGGDRPVRPAPRAPAPLHVLLGLALHLAQPRLARAGRGARAHPPRRRLRDGGEPPVAARHPRALPALRALQVGVEDRELPRAVHRLEHVAQ